VQESLCETYRNGVTWIDQQPIIIILCESAPKRIGHLGDSGVATRPILMVALNVWSLGLPDGIGEQYASSYLTGGWWCSAWTRWSSQARILIDGIPGRVPDDGSCGA
jgi:hypothetical protein